MRVSEIERLAPSQICSRRADCQFYSTSTGYVFHLGCWDLLNSKFFKYSRIYKKPLASSASVIYPTAVRLEIINFWGANVSNSQLPNCNKTQSWCGLFSQHQDLFPNLPLHGWLLLWRLGPHNQFVVAFRAYTRHKFWFLRIDAWKMASRHEWQTYWWPLQYIDDCMLLQRRMCTTPLYWKIFSAWLP